MATGLTRPDPRITSTPSSTEEPIDPQLLSLMDRVTADIESEQQTRVDGDIQQFDQNYSRPVGMGVRALGSVATGVAGAMYETKDFLMGEPTFAEKDPQRIANEKAIADVKRAGAGYGITQSVSQFLTGMLGTGKFQAPAKAGKGLKLGFEALRGAAVGSVVFDPQEERLSNLVEEFPALQNPVTAFLAADPSDSDAEGRFKNALEGIGMDYAIAGVFALSAKAWKLRKAGKAEEADMVLDEAAAGLNDLESRPAVDIQPNDMRSKIAQVVDPASRAATDIKLGDMRSKIAGGPLKGKSTRGKNSAQEADFERARQELDGQAMDGAVMQGNAPSAKAILKPPAPLLNQEAERLITLSDTLSKAKRVDGESVPLPHTSPYINWTKIAGPEDVATYTREVASQLEPRLRAVAGDVISDAQVRTMVGARAQAFGEDPIELYATIRRQGRAAKTMAADMEAAYVVANGLFQDVHRLATQIKMGMLDGFSGDRSLATKELARQAAIASEVLGSARAMTATAGRALRRMRSDFKITPDMLKDLEGKHGAQLVEAIYQSQGDPRLMQKALNPSLWTKAEGVFSHLIVNGPLYWYPTHVINGIGNLYLLAARPTERLLGSLFLGGSGKIIRRQALKEYRTSISAIHDGWEAAKGAFLSGDSKLAGSNPYTDGVAGNLPLDLKPVDSIDALLKMAIQLGHWKTATSMPTRLLGAADEMVKTIRYRAVVQAKASVAAEDLGLLGREAEAYIAKQLEEAFDDLGRATDRAAMLEAQATTLSTPLAKGTMGHQLQNAVTSQPILRAVFTYVRTPINALRYGIRMTPGLQFLQKEMREALLHPDPTVRAQAYGQVAMGALWMGAISPFITSGMITGGGPSDPKLRAELQAQGWKPYSIVWEAEDGTKHYFPLGRLDPPGLLIGIMADAHDIMQNPDRYEEGENMLAVAAIALMKNIGNKTYLTSLDQTVKALRDPDTSLLRWLGNTAEAATPFSALLRGINTDDTAREARTFADHMLGAMPGYSQTLEPRYDALGEPITVQRGLWTSESNTSAVRRELQRLILETGKGLTPASPQRQSGIDLRDYTLTSGRSAYSVLNELISKPPTGKPLVEALETVINSPAYETAPDGDGSTKGTRLWMLNRVVAEYREAAYKSLLANNRDLAEATWSNRRKAFAAHKALKSQQEQTGSPIDRAIESLLPKN